MRGKPREKEKTKWQRRITPAHAGKTHDDELRQHPVEDHPRACGENVVFGVVSV